MRDGVAIFASNAISPTLVLGERDILHEATSQEAPPGSGHQTHPRLVAQQNPSRPNLSLTYRFLPCRLDCVEGSSVPGPFGLIVLSSPGIISSSTCKFLIIFGKRKTFLILMKLFPMPTLPFQRTS